MSDIFGNARQRAPREPQGGGNGRRVLVPTLITLAALLFLGSIFTSVWTDRLWFKSVGYSDVYQNLLVTRIGMFAFFGLLFGAVVIGNLYLAHRFRPENPSMRRDDPAFRYRTALNPILKPVTLVVGLIVVAFAGSVGASRWETFKLWWNGTSFGQDDAQFGRDIGFYIFDYPWWRFLTSYSFAMIVVTVLGVVFVHYVYGGIRMQGRGPKFTRAAQVHLSILVGLGIATRAVSYWLDRFGYVIGNSGLIDGVGFTDDNARIPAKNILIGVAIVCALLFFAAVFIRSWVLPALGLGMLVLSSVLLGGIWPAVMQAFQVNPSEPDKEGPYIARNIDATRDAFNLSDSESQPYTASTQLTPTELTASAEERVSTRLLDPTLISDAFQQLQQVRGYYTVPDTLDVDRYQIGDDEIPQDIIIAARELDLNGLPDTQRNWANDHTVYTHGYGVIAARGNQRGPQGEPVWVEKDIPPVGELNITTPPRIYFGENSPDYSIVGRPEGSEAIEVDVPRGSSNDAEGGQANASANTYDGEGGVPVGNLFNKALYAFKFAEPNIVLSNRVNDASKILYDRSPRDRVKKVAPWLTVDGDTFPAVVNGRVVWIVDGYTTSNAYPYSESRSLREATADTLTQNRAQAALPTDEINYMRNSVKAVVDAYDGTVELYQWDTEDPILKTWMKTFPGTVLPKSDIDDSLMSHLRYPVDLFKVQRDVLSRYHVTDEQTFYEDGERWRVPGDPTLGRNAATLQPPYYLSIARPGADEPNFSLTSVFLPNSRQNLASFVSVNAEATSEDYGTMQILELPSNTQVPGPSQIANDFQTDRGVTQALLQFEQSEEARILRGNLLTLPVGDGLLYVQPVYIQRSADVGTYPVLQFVAVSFGEAVGFGQTLDEALRVAVGLEGADTTDTTGDGTDSGGDTGDDAATPDPEPSPSPDAEGKTTAEYLEDASNFYNQAQDALQDGDLQLYQERIDQMGGAITDAQDAQAAGQ